MPEPQIRRRKHATRWSVKAADRAAAIFIGVGGAGTIIAVSAVCLFLLSVVIPLILPGESEQRPTIETAWNSNTPIQMTVDEYRVMAWSFFRDGSLQLIRLDTGELLSTQQLVPGDSMTAWAFPPGAANAAFGFADGSLRIGKIEFVTDFPDGDLLPESASAMQPGESIAVGDAVIQLTPEGQYRRQRLAIDIGEPIAGSEAGIVLIDVLEQTAGPLVTFADAGGGVFVNRIRESENLMTGEMVTQMRSTELPSFDGEHPTYLHTSESGNTLLLGWADGGMVRYDLRDLSAPAIAEELRITDTGKRPTAVEFLLGRTTLLVGDDTGGLSAWFTHRSPTATSTDGIAFTATRTFDGETPVLRVAPSPRTRVVAVGHENGTIQLYQITSGARILQLDAGAPIEQLVVAPKADGVLALAGGKLWHWDIDERHPEATLAALFTPVWYEGYEKPEHVWQSSSGTDDFESKLGMWPLVFGTLKATFYSMLFGIPLALLAAIFTSEFLAPSLRNKVKTLIELMASLPSVVLGFLAALVFAPFVQRLVPTVLVGFVTIPAAFLIGAYLWQLLPYHLSLRFERLQVLVMAVLLPIGMAAAVWLGPVVENIFFIGDMQTWLDGNRGSGLGGWIILFLPLAAATVVFVFGRTINPRFRAASTQMDRTQVAGLDFARFGLGALLTFAVAAIVAWLLTEIGLDPRGPNSFLDTYVQRNALVVGFVMGFAIIPIIYTIAEDALSAVPEHLRAASLGAGATPWQTAIRIVIPTAMSGLFSAIMVGLGTRRRRDHDRADGGRQHTGARNEHLQRLSHAVGQHRGRAPGGGQGQHTLPHAVSRRVHSFCHDVSY